ncbi:MAG: hypothetical protein IKA74_04480 [Clostridia bacterium]|nr:hypothetical protein [Clostridia bacterium]
MNYDEFIKGINDEQKIKQIDFYIDGYAHYKNCSIGRYKEKIFGNEFNFRITCILTKDHSEYVSFYETFKEDYKLFNFGKKGKFTLKDVWDKVVITKIEYFTS